LNATFAEIGCRITPAQSALRVEWQLRLSTATFSPAARPLPQQRLQILYPAFAKPD